MTTTKTAEVVALEYTTVKVPYEVLNKKFRQAQKIIDREISQLSNQITSIMRLPSPELQRQAMLAFKDKLTSFRKRVCVKLLFVSDKLQLFICSLALFFDNDFFPYVY